ncbi:glycoside hydrolase family 88 protein [Spongiivirga citrea]|uniref:Glucuronyl hydrolase n=1 Tax=Spongiivirga citrea TaxID=1481457 RepID=A0A6M0CLJ9_9FLAO|nr:glycoside hydrolase family 88 protein [Spongiivirga citrea]NER17853.1 glucuronyl hydrolase [Spongiivirga citrea]
MIKSNYRIQSSKIIQFIFCVLTIYLFISCNGKNKSYEENNDQPLTIDSLLALRYQQFLKYQVDSTAFPRSYNPKNKTIKKVPSSNWTSGFYAGALWQIFELTGEETFKKKAEEWTAFIEKEKFNDRTHDMGFKVFCSFGNGLKHNNDNDYKDIIVKSAQTLSTRFDEKIGSIRSWDFGKEKWQFPVIIDNMMNLELLFEATKISKDSSFHKLAVIHANTTLKNHFRPDHSTWHVLDYDTISGDVRMRVTHQGINDDSAWARGQAWAINGFTMAYRYTRDPKYLEQAKATANFFINHKNLPEDGIPYWDFDDPAIPNSPRDVSAAAITASALVELYEYTQDQTYLNYSKKVLNSLRSTNYILPKEMKIPFILDHSSGDYSQKSEMDEPIIYGDYYFLQTALRLKDL